MVGSYRLRQICGPNPLSGNLTTAKQPAPMKLVHVEMTLRLMRGIISRMAII
jgi:hypothetical protein